MNTALNLDAPVSISTRMLKSDMFMSLHGQVMATVEETAAYLDGAGRAERLQRGEVGMAAYGNSAMALTTYLMQMASQVLMLRSIRDGQMSLENAQAEYRKMQTVNRTDLNLEAGDKLPSRLKELMETSVGLRKRLSGFFTQLVEPVFVTSPNSVHEQMSLLATAFGR